MYPFSKATTLPLRTQQADVEYISIYRAVRVDGGLTFYRDVHMSHFCGVQ
jgi:hypothetical protein